jgi:hypothetical protein
MRCGRRARPLFAAALAALCGVVLAASGPLEVPPVPALQRFLAIEYGVIRQATTVRHLEARNDHYGTEAWLDVRTDADATGFRFTVLAEGGSGFVRSHALRPTLEQEQRAWSDGEATRSWFTTSNYEFTDRGTSDDGLARIGVQPRRRDMLLVDGHIFLRPDTGDLIRIEGALGKSPSFWTRRVNVVRHYARIDGVQVPVAVESVAQVRIAGASSFRMNYRYERLNGKRVE